MTKNNIPNIIYIGLMRSGSTYLRSYFTQHPNIYWARRAWFFQLESDDKLRRQKYLKYFAKEQSHSCFIDMYESLSLGYVLTKTPGKNYANEKSPEWSGEWAMNLDSLMDGSIIKPDQNEVARRIKYVLPDSRILVVLRNQSDWLRSMYLHYISYLPSNRHLFVDFLNTLEGKASIASGCYDQMLNAYEYYFGRENMHVVLFEELIHEETMTLSKLCEFLHVPYWPMDKMKADQNKGKTQIPDINQNPQPRALSWLEHLWKSTSSNKHTQVLTETDMAYIRSLYAVSNYRTSIWLDRDLSQFGYSL